MNRSQKRQMARMARKDSKTQYKQMMRTQMLHNAAESLSAKELEMAMLGSRVMYFVETKLDDNGVPVDGETKQVKLSKLDVRRLEGVLETKKANEKQYLETHDK